MKFKGFIFLLGVIFIGCATYNPNRKFKCSRYLDNDFAAVSNHESYVLIDYDTIPLTEVRFECAFSALYTVKSMYQLFGRCTGNIKSDKFIPAWRDVDLLSDGNSYHIYASGIETTGNMHSALMVTNSDGKDMLSETSSKKQEIIELFSTTIREGKDLGMTWYYEYLREYRPR